MFHVSISKLKNTYFSKNNYFDHNETSQKIKQTSYSTLKNKTNKL